MIVSGGAVDSSSVESFVAQIIGGGVGGGLLMAIVGIIRQTMGGPTASA
jgi:Na+-transporting NADH:ubiquinone oxidoreductase subunit NqrD